MVIRVKGYLNFRKLVPERHMEFPEQGTTLRSLLVVLVEEIGESFQSGIFDERRGGVLLNVAVLVNGQHYTHLPKGLETPLQDGDQVAIFPPIAGG